MIKIVCVGKIKEKYYEEAINEYIKRINKYINIQIIEIKDYNTDVEKITLLKEKEQLLKHINKNDYLVCLDINGDMLDSVELSNKINNMLIFNSNITFIIGGSCGLDKDIINMCNYRLSFSKLTFPHQLFRVILLEQIYRSFKIINNETYHK